MATCGGRRCKLTPVKKKTMERDLCSSAPLTNWAEIEASLPTALE